MRHPDWMPVSRPAQIAMLEMMIANGIHFVCEGLSCEDALSELMTVPTKKELSHRLEIEMSQIEPTNGIFIDMQQRTKVDYPDESTLKALQKAWAISYETPKTVNNFEPKNI